MEQEKRKPPPEKKSGKEMREADYAEFLTRFSALTKSRTRSWPV